MKERSGVGLVRTLTKLRAERATGTLCVRAEQAETTLYFHDGALLLAEGGTVGETLRRLVVDRGVVTPEQYGQSIAVLSRELTERADVTLADVLVRLGFATPEVLLGLERELGRRRVVRCLQWHSAELWLVPERRPVSDHRPMPLDALIFEGMSHYFAHEQLIELLRPVALSAARLTTPTADISRRLELDAELTSVVGAIDGRRTIEQLVIDHAEAVPLFGALLLLGMITTGGDRAGGGLEVVQRRKTRDPRRRRTSHPSLPAIDAATPMEPRRRRATWREADLPRRDRGTHQALDHPAPPPAARRPPSAPPPDSDAAALRAELFYRRGLRALWLDDLTAAEADFERALGLEPDELEYRLCALWVTFLYRHRAGQPLEVVRRQLDKLVAATVQHNRDLAIPPYLKGHLARLDGDRAEALRFFRIAASRDPDNVDAERYIRLLEAR